MEILPSTATEILTFDSPKMCHPLLWGAVPLISVLSNHGGVMSQLVEVEIPHLYPENYPSPITGESLVISVFLASGPDGSDAYAPPENRLRNSGQTGASRIFAHALKPQVIKAKRLQQLFPATCP
jgi:hypothetical protein